LYVNINSHYSTSNHFKSREENIKQNIKECDLATATISRYFVADHKTSFDEFSDQKEFALSKTEVMVLPFLSVGKMTQTIADEF